MIFRDQIENAWSEELVAIRNQTGSPISAFKFVVPVGVYTPTLPDLPYPLVEALSSLTQKPIALLTASLANNTSTNYTSSIRAKKRGLVQITGFDTSGAALGDKVYCSATGDATLTPTSIEVGVVITLSTNGTIYLDLPSSSSSSGGGHTIEDEGTPLPQQSTLNFTGAGVTVTDFGGKTVVSIPGGGSSSERQFIYRPSEISPSGNVYNNLSTLLTAAQAVNGKKLILVDITAHQVVPAATYNFVDCTIIYSNPVSNSEQYELQFAAFTSFSGLPDAIGVAIRIQGTLPHIFTTTQPVTNIRFIEYGKIIKAGAAAFIRANTAGHVVNIYVSGIGADIVNAQTLTGVILLQNGATANFYVDSLSANALMTPNLFGGNAGNTVNLYGLNGKVRTSSANNGAFSGTINQTTSEFRSRFTNLADAPSAYTLGDALKAVRVNAGATGLEFYTPSGGPTVVSTKTAAYDANSNEVIPSDTSGGSFTIKLPLTPTHGDIVVVIDVDGTFATNNLTVDRNGSSINGIADNVDLDINYGIFNFQFFTSFGWILT